jgi:hypothetical protein
MLLYAMPFHCCTNQSSGEKFMVHLLSFFHWSIKYLHDWHFHIHSYDIQPMELVQSIKKSQKQEGSANGKDLSRMYGKRKHVVQTHIWVIVCSWTSSLLNLGTSSQMQRCRLMPLCRKGEMEEGWITDFPGTTHRYKCKFLVTFSCSTLDPLLNVLFAHTASWILFVQWILAWTWETTRWPPSDHL